MMKGSLPPSVLAVLLFGLAACETAKSPAAATSTTAPPQPAPSLSSTTTGVTGMVVELSASGDRRPVPNLRLKIRRGGPTDSALGGDELPDVVTDANGRYEIPGITNGLFFVTTAPGSTHRFLCDYYPLDLVSVRLLHLLTTLEVVPATWSGDRVPPGMSIRGTSVYGVVSERVGGALQPIAGATVTLDTGLQDPPATSNASGFYMVCSVVGTDQNRTISARRSGYRQTSRTISGGWDSLVDLELVRD